jgi:signal transduction histidine kinase
MKRKTVIITMVFLITILLIAILRYYIKKDTVRTQKERLDFFTENLSIQKNSLLNSFQNYSILVVEGINNDQLLINSLDNWRNHSPATAQKETIKTIAKLSSNYVKCLSNVGFTSLTYSINTGINEVFRFTIETEPGTIYSTFLHQENLPTINKFPLSSFYAGNTTIEYRYAYPLPLKDRSSGIQIETGFSFSLLKKILKQNIPNSMVGFLWIGDNPTFIKDSSDTDIKFVRADNNYPLFFDSQFLLKIDDYLDAKILKTLNSHLTEPVATKTNGNFSIYLSSTIRPQAISFNLLDLDSKKGKFYLVTLNHDFMLDKTNDWNNQIFTINLIIIILILIGVIYLFINRESLLKEKESIEESEIKLKMMNESKDKFFSIIAHDLKNPFNGIMGMTSFLNESYDQIDDKERKEIISDLNISSKNAFNLLQNLLEWTRTQSGTIKNVPVKVDPASIIEMSLETVTNLARNKEIEIEQTINTTKSGYADENLVSTVLRNLFTNAVKFSPRKSTIEVSVKQYEKELVFCVKDTGIGLKHNEIDQLFRIDVNFHKKGTEEETGTGLGLKICKEFVEYCHGRIWVISEPAEGSSFYFTIPIYSE